LRALIITNRLVQKTHQELEHFKKSINTVLICRKFLIFVLNAEALARLPYPFDLNYFSLATQNLANIYEREFVLRTHMNLTSVDFDCQSGIKLEWLYGRYIQHQKDTLEARQNAKRIHS